MTLAIAKTETGLPELAEQINATHRQVEEHAHSAVQHAIRCGELLSRAKEQCEQGTWLDWLGEHFEGSDRTAQLYMRIHRHRDRIGAKARRVALLSLRDADKILADRKARKPDAVWDDVFEAINKVEAAVKWMVEHWPREYLKGLGSRLQRIAEELIEKGEVNLGTQGVVPSEDNCLPYYAAHRENDRRKKAELRLVKEYRPAAVPMGAA